MDAATVDALDFRKGGGVIPTIVCSSDDGAPRMLAYSSRESLQVALAERAGVYWSRSRERLWRKGGTSGNVQRLDGVAVDCDRDALIFYVAQTGAVCHLDRSNCFEGETPFTWSTLAARVRTRAEGMGTLSFTRELLADPELLAAKLCEEAAEVAEAQKREDVVWECADLLYFMTVKMHAAGVGIGEVMAELARRAQ